MFCHTAMKWIIILSLLCCKAVAQPARERDWSSLLKASDVHLRKIASTGTSATMPPTSAMKEVLDLADQSFQLSELTTLVNICRDYCHSSSVVTKALINLLRENHPIYAGRSPIETSQFRGFLMASLQHFPPQEELYRYVKAELMFSNHAYTIAAAAAAARKFNSHAAELIPLLEFYLQNTFIDESVDITTPELNYPLAKPTRARHEILLTLRAFGASAYRSLKLIDAIAQGRGAGGFDTTLCNLALKTAGYIRGAKFPVLRPLTARTVSPGVSLIAPKDRNVLMLNQFTFMDQEGRRLTFDHFKNKPFVLTFFYTQCTNGRKCVSTIQRLSELEAACAKDNLSKKVGIYCMTYDWDFDSPAILKKYGEMYGFSFGETARFLKAIDYAGIAIANRLQLRVSYGAGTVSQHGIQLFVFDKKNRIAAVYDNDVWNVTEVKNYLTILKDE